MNKTLPTPLIEIFQEATERRLPQSNVPSFGPVWRAHTSTARQQIPEIHIEDDGGIVSLGELSPGCTACKEGSWDCIFMTMRCNLDCPFCYSPHAISKDYVGSAFGTTPQQIAENHAKTVVTGISFSGGEPFLDPKKLFDWVSWFKRRYPEKYYWIYTNGLAIREDDLRNLGEAGVDEIRFNMAATGYDHPEVMKNLAKAVRFIPNVTVEIPSIPGNHAKLIACVLQWHSLGVKYLNLHELLYEPGTNSASMAGKRLEVITADGHRTAIDPESRALTLAVMKHVKDEGLALSVNDCSLQSKLRQLRGRRKALAPLLKESYERFLGDDAYESCCCSLENGRVQFFHPDALGEWQRKHSDSRFFRLVRTAPMSIYERKSWISLKEITEDKFAETREKP